MIDSRAVAIALAAGFGAWALLRARENQSVDYGYVPGATVYPQAPNTDWQTADYFPETQNPAFLYPSAYPSAQTFPFLNTSASEFNAALSWDQWITPPVETAPAQSPPVLDPWLTEPDFSSDVPVVDPWESEPGYAPSTPPVLDPWASEPGYAPATQAPATADAPYGDFVNVKTWNRPPTSAPAQAQTQSVNPDVNVTAFLALIRKTEGTDPNAYGFDPYRVLYGYSGQANSFADHPARMGWPGVRLPDQYCINVRLPPGCVSTAAGAYQFNLPTWKDLERRFGVRDFSPQSQDARTIELLQDIGALPLIVSGRITEALQSASARWASLPMSASGQPKVTLQTALAYFTQAGGVIA